MHTLKLSRNFFLHEFTWSQAAIRHGIEIAVPPGSGVHKNLTRLCALVLQPLRNALGPVFVTSGYRPQRLNRLIGGARNSAHIWGLAADIVVPGSAPLEVCRAIARARLPFDALIHEFGLWTHVQIAPAGKQPRGNRLTAIKKPRPCGKPKTVYLPEILEV